MSDLVEIVGKAEAAFEEISYREYRELFNEQARAIIAAIEASGHRIVPVEATDSMWAAGRVYMGKALADPATIWSEMLAAAPRMKL